MEEIGEQSVEHKEPEVHIQPEPKKHKEKAINKIKPLMTFVKAHPTLIIFLLLIIFQFVPNNEGTLPWGGIHTRLVGKHLPFADTVAQQSIENYVRQQATNAVNEEYPNLPNQRKQSLVEERVREALKDQESQVLQQKQRLRQEVVDHYSYEENGKSWLYMPDIDPYYYLRYARNIEEKGHPYDELKDGKPWDNHMTAPIGTGPEQTIHPYVLAYMHSFFSIFDASMPLMEAANYFSIVFILLSLIPAFFITRRIAGNVGGVFAATMLSLLPSVMRRTPWGHADTDAYNIFFPLYIIWFLFLALSAKTKKKRAFFAALSGATVGLYSGAWAGWWYVFDFVMAAFAVYLGWEVLTNWKTLKKGIKTFWKESNIQKYLFILVIFFLTAAAVVSFFSNFENFINSPLYPIRFTNIKQAAFDNLWPNVFTTVAELNPTNLTNVMNEVGGKLMFSIALLGILLLIFRRMDNKKLNINYSALLTIWFIGTIYAATKGLRFTLLLGPAFAVAFGAAAGLAFEYGIKYGKKHFNLNKIVAGTAVILVFALLIVNPAQGGSSIARQSYNAVKGDIPIMNDGWWNALKQIQEDSEPDAIINSWWDFGHHFKYVADRRVTFDGASQNSPQAHWIGRVLQTNDEEEAVAILRMLDCGATRAYDNVLNETEDPIVSIRLVKQIIMEDKAAARQSLEDAGVNPDNVLPYTHCEPPQDYFIASSDMIGKAGVWAHFGMWSFERAQIWKELRHLPKEEAVAEMVKRYGYSEEKAEDEYNQVKALRDEDAANQWISPWPGYIGEPTDCKLEGKDTLSCGSVIFNTTKNEAQVFLNQGMATAKKMITYDKEGNFKETELNGTSDITVVIWPGQNGPVALPEVAYLANSMFTRMFYMNGLGLKHFKPFFTSQQYFHGPINVYKVDWEQTEPWIPLHLRPKDAVENGAEVRLNYIGYLEDGSVFDASIPGWEDLNVTKNSDFDDFETRSLVFTIGDGRVITGLEKGITGMKKGEERVITIPPEEAYGTDPDAHVLGNKTLMFKIRIEDLR